MSPCWMAGDPAARCLPSGANTPLVARVSVEPQPLVEPVVQTLWSKVADGPEMHPLPWWPTLLFTRRLLP